MCVVRWIAALLLIVALLAGCGDGGSGGDESGPEPGQSESQPGQSESEPGQSESQPGPSESARLSVVSSPAGATVEVGIQAVNNVVTSGTGRVVGTTPIANLELSDADVSYGSVSTNLYVEVRLDGYVPALEVFGLSDAGLEPGKTYEVDVTLNPISSESARLSVVSSPAGATVEVGIQAVNNVVTSGTGRVVGTTPIANLELSDADVSYGSVSTNLYVEVRLDGYVPALEVFGLSDAGLEPGKTYEVDVTLNPL